MSKYKLTDLIWESINLLLKDVDTQKNIVEKSEKQFQKVHFIPVQHRVFGSVLQSLNIKFGNFLEMFIKKLIDKRTCYQIENFKGNAINKAVSRDEEGAINEYLNKRESSSQPPSVKELNGLLQTPFSEIEAIDSLAKKKKIDVDLVFRKNNDIYFVEIKYEDNHDTGKLPDIYRKIFRTYFSLRRHYKNQFRIRPFLFYFLEQKRWDSKYMVEKENVLRGQDFWTTFSDIDAQEINECFEFIANNEVIVNKFDQLKNKIDEHIKSKN